MTIKFFRKKYFSLFLATLILFVSCTNDTNVNSEITADQFKEYHKTIKNDLQKVTKNTKNTNTISKEVFEEPITNLPVYEKQLEENMILINENGLKDFLIQKNIDPILLEQFEYYYQNKDNENVYQMLIDKYNFKTTEDAIMLIRLIEVYDLVTDELMFTGKISNETSRRRITYSCGLAIAGAVVATAGFAFVTGGAGLFVALLGKGLATASLIDSCR